MSTRDARKWQPLCEHEDVSRCRWRGKCFTMDWLAGPGWRITVDPDGTAWTWSTEE